MIIIVVGILMMIRTIIKVIYCFPLAWYLSKLEWGKHQCYFTEPPQTSMSSSLIVCWALGRKIAERWPKIAQVVFCRAFRDIDHQIHSLWKRKSCVQFRILEEFSKCELGDCFISCFKIVVPLLKHNWSVSGISQSLLSGYSGSDTLSYYLKIWTMHL